MSGALAAVDVQDLAGDERRVLQIQDGVDDIVDVAHPAERMQAGEGGVRLRGCMGVRMTPRATALARMPRSAYSMASDLVTALRPPLVSDASADGTCGTGVIHEAGRDVDQMAAALVEHRGDGAAGQSKKPRRFTPVTAS